MDTSTSPKRHHFSRTEVRWQVYFFTPHTQIQGVTVNISPEGALVACRELPPADSNFRVVIKPPDRYPLDITGKLVWTTVCCSTNGTETVGADVQFESISEKDRHYLEGWIISNSLADIDLMVQKQMSSLEQEVGKEPVPTMVQKQMSSPEQEVGKEPVSTHVPHIANIRLPVFYNKGGKTVRAVGSRFSTRGCHLYTKLAPPKGAVFSLKMQNPRTGKSIQVDSSVVQCKRCVVNNHWGMIIRFMNLTGTARKEIREILQDASGTTAKEPRHLKTAIGQTILRHFSRKKTVH